MQGEGAARAGAGARGAAPARPPAARLTIREMLADKALGVPMSAVVVHGQAGQCDGHRIKDIGRQICAQSARAVGWVPVVGTRVAMIRKRCTGAHGRLQHERGEDPHASGSGTEPPTSDFTGVGC